MAYTVEVYNDGYIPEYTESFDAPDWQTALIAAADLAKIDDRDRACSPICENYGCELSPAAQDHTQLGSSCVAWSWALHGCALCGHCFDKHHFDLGAIDAVPCDDCPGDVCVSLYSACDLGDEEHYRAATTPVTEPATGSEFLLGECACGAFLPDVG